MWPNLPPNVTQEMLSADFWLARAPHAEAPFATPKQIAAFNARVYERLGVPPVLALPQEVSAERVRAWVAQYSLPEAPRYGYDGRRLTAEAFRAVVMRAMPKLSARVRVRFGLTVRRAALRAWPSDAPITAEPFAYALDRAQETHVDIGQPVAAVLRSRDGRWLFALTPHYWGWLRADAVAWGAREQVAAYAEAPDFLVTVAPRGLVGTSEGGVTPQMGTRLPLLAEEETAWRVRVPVREADGALSFAEGYAPRAAGHFVRGHLPPTPRSVLAQAFKLLGEPYAWGGGRLGIFGRDCSRLVQDVYATVGVHLPRNAGQQGDVGRVLIAFSAEMAAEERRAALVERGQVGALLELPGHVMLYLGHVAGRPYVLHDTLSAPYAGVIVSTLALGAERSLLERLRRAVVVG